MLRSILHRRTEYLMRWRCCFCGKKARTLVFGSLCCMKCATAYLTTVMDSLKSIGVLGGVAETPDEESTADALTGFA